MATDAVIEFKYSDGEDLCGLYLAANTHMADFIPAISLLFQQRDAGDEDNRTNWDYLATDVICKLISKHRWAKLLPKDRRDPVGVIHHMVITPRAEVYADKGMEIVECLHVKVTYGGSDEILFDGTLADYAQLEKKQKQQAAVERLRVAIQKAEKYGLVRTKGGQPIECQDGDKLLLVVPYLETYTQSIVVRVELKDGTRKSYMVGPDVAGGF